MCAHITHHIDIVRIRIVNVAHTSNLDIDTNIDMTTIMAITTALTINLTLTLINNITFTFTHIQLPIFLS